MFPIAALLSFGSTLIDKFFPDPNQAQQAKAQLLEMQTKGELDQMLGQLEINKVEASNQSVFVSGWRPAIGWVCALALAYQYLFKPLMTWGAAVTGHTVPPMPGLDDNLWQLMMGMLGMGGLRTFEKINGVASK
jgi:hypothetical protein